jgi:hypothetical protein
MNLNLNEDAICLLTLDCQVRLFSDWACLVKFDLMVSSEVVLVYKSQMSGVQYVCNFK